MSPESNQETLSPPGSERPFGKKWVPLIKSIKQGNCVLVLGPRAAIDPRDPCRPILPVQIAERLELELKAAEGSDSVETVVPAPSQQIPLDNLARISTRYVQEREQRLRSLPPLRELVQEFYEQINGLTTGLHEYLAQVPFCVCLCTTPDSMLRTAFQKAGKFPIEDYYSITQQRHALEGEESLVKKFTPQQPLVYHLMGSTEDLDSLLMTEDDLVDLPICLMKKETSLPQALTDLLQSEKNRPVFLFIGFGFGSNYSRFLIKLLCGINALPRDGHLPQGREIKPYFVEENALDNTDSVMMFDSTSSFCQSSLQEFTRELSEEFQSPASEATSSPSSTTAAPRSRPVVFLCHCSEDKDRIAWMCDELSRHGIDYWIDKDQLRGGDRWDEKIQRVIERDIDYFVIIASKSMMHHDEHYFYKEINAAIERSTEFNKHRVFILPVVIDDSQGKPDEFVIQISPDLNKVQCADLYHDPDRKKFDRLVQDILEDWKGRKSR
jgi:hypothetical protein